MINKEKLINHLNKEIETSFMGANDRDKAIVWHCERLIKLINGGAFDDLDSNYIDLKEQNKRYREALKFYADRDNYKLEHFDPNLDDYMSTVDYDEGQKARQTIGVKR